MNGRLLEIAKPPERYVDGNELATLMGVSLSTIKRMRHEGMPVESWGMSRTRRYLPSLCMSWARSRMDQEPDERNSSGQPQSKE